MKRMSLSLQARIAAVVISTFVLLIAIGMGAAGLHERRVSEALNESLRRDSAVIWRAVTTESGRRLTGEADRLADDPAIVAALSGGDAAELRRVLAPHLRRLGEQFGSVRIEVLSESGTLVFNSGGEFPWRPTLEADQITRIAAGERMETVQLDWTRRVVAVHGRPVASVGGGPGALLVEAGIERDLRTLKNGTGAEILLVNRRGRLLAGTAPNLWEALAPLVGATADGMIDLDGRSLAPILLPINYPGGLAARLYLVHDRSELETQRRRSDVVGLLAVGLAALVAAGGLRLWLRSAFRPLEHAVAAVNALSAGDASVSLPPARREDEIGRLSLALERFREQNARLGRLQRAEERRRRRQEGFIHREMTALADTLEPLAREEILRDLGEIEAEGSQGENSMGLGVMATAFGKMSLRVRRQQQHLQELIAELREALKMKAAYFQLQQELDIAREIQLSMLPLDFPDDHPRIALHALMRPAKEVGGDFYDFFFIDDDRLGLVVADVSGKGVPAALFMAISRTLLKATALFGSPPARCLENLNNLLAENNEKNLFVTVFYGILDMRNGEFTYCNAGHNPPYLVRADGTVEPLPRTGGTALAIMEDLPQRDAQVVLAPGETLFLFTDGVVEAHDAAHALFADDRLVNSLGKAAGLTPETMISRLDEELQAFAGQAEQFDDITCLAVRRHP